MSQLKVVYEQAFIDSRDQSLSTFREMHVSNRWFNRKTIQRERDQKNTCLLNKRDILDGHQTCMPAV